MLLSAITFWRWLTGRPMSLDAGASPADSEFDRRVWVRFAANLNIRCGEVGNEADEGVSATICDISRGGVKIIASRRFEPGTVLSVELPAARGQGALTALACVLHTHPHGEHEWTMGCRFSGELSDEHLQTFGALRARPSSPDPRSWSRFPCDVPATYQRIGGDETRRSARVLNIATAGMALRVDEEVAIGELLHTDLLGTDGQPIVSILACVVHVQTSALGRVLGCNFIRELSDKDLTALL